MSASFTSGDISAGGVPSELSVGALSSLFAVQDVEQTRNSGDEGVEEECSGTAVEAVAILNSLATLGEISGLVKIEPDSE